MNEAEPYIEQKELLRESLWRSLLVRAIDFRILKTMADLPDENDEGYLVMLQIVRWNTTVSGWENPLMTSTLRSFIGDIFPDKQFYSITALMRTNVYSVMLRPRETSFDRSRLLQHLSFLCSAFDMYMPCAIACYVSKSIQVRNMPGEWDNLLELQNENVANKKGVFAMPLQEEAPTVFSPRIMQWKQLLSAQKGGAMEREAFAMLEEMDNTGIITAGALTNFYQDFMKMLYSLNVDTGTRPVTDNIDTVHKVQNSRGNTNRTVWKVRKESRLWKNHYSSKWEVHTDKWEIIYSRTWKYRKINALSVSGARDV